MLDVKTHKSPWAPVKFHNRHPKSSWDSQDFGDVNMVLKWFICTSTPGHNELTW